MSCPRNVVSFAMIAVSILALGGCVAGPSGAEEPTAESAEPDLGPDMTGSDGWGHGPGGGGEVWSPGGGWGNGFGAREGTGPAHGRGPGG